MRLRRIGRDSVAVTYVHRAADGPGHDAFTFAAQAPGTAVSAAETVEIDVADAIPAGRPGPGRRGRTWRRPRRNWISARWRWAPPPGLTLTLENRGNGLATGRLDPPAPWTVDGDGSYRLGRGGRQTVPARVPSGGARVVCRDACR